MLALLLALSFVAADDLPSEEEAIRAYREFVESTRGAALDEIDQQILQIEKTIVSARNGRIDPTGIPYLEDQREQFKTNRDKTKAIADRKTALTKAKKRLADMKDKITDPEDPWINPGAMKVGIGGHLPAGRIMQVVDKENLLVIFEWRSYRTGEPHAATVWITRFSTRGMADDTAFDSSLLFLVVGTKAVRSLGQATVFLLVPVN